MQTSPASAPLACPHPLTVLSSTLTARILRSLRVSSNLPPPRSNRCPTLLPSFFIGDPPRRRTKRHLLLPSYPGPWAQWVVKWTASAGACLQGNQKASSDRLAPSVCGTGLPDALISSCDGVMDKSAVHKRACRELILRVRHWWVELEIEDMLLDDPLQAPQ